LCKKIQKVLTLQQKIKIPALDAKVSIFKQHQLYYLPNHPKGITWHKHYLKDKKHNHNRGIIV
jgi:hypothetical protein